MGRAGPHRRHALTVAALTASGLLLALALPAGAHAATTTPCPGRKVRTLTFSAGAVHVYRSGDHICALTLPGRAGAARTMSVSVQARGNRPVVDRGRYTLRAGPVTVHAGHRCVRLKGSVGSASVSTGWVLC